MLIDYESRKKQREPDRPTSFGYYLIAPIVAVTNLAALWLISLSYGGIEWLQAVLVLLGFVISVFGIISSRQKQRPEIPFLSGLLAAGNSLFGMLYLIMLVTGVIHLISFMSES